MSETILYGIKQCDTVRKARRWLDEQSIAYRFHDFRSDGLSTDNAAAVIVETPTLIRRPLLETAGKRLVGFDPDEYRALLL